MDYPTTKCLPCIKMLMGISGSALPHSASACPADSHRQPVGRFKPHHRHQSGCIRQWLLVLNGRWAGFRSGRTSLDRHQVRVTLVGHHDRKDDRSTLLRAPGHGCALHLSRQSQQYVGLWQPRRLLHQPPTRIGPSFSDRQPVAGEHRDFGGGGVGEPPVFHHASPHPFIPETK